MSTLLVNTVFIRLFKASNSLFFFKKKPIMFIYLRQRQLSVAQMTDLVLFGGAGDSPKKTHKTLEVLFVVRWWWQAQKSQSPLLG